MGKSIVKIFISIVALTLILSIGNSFFEAKDLYTVITLMLSVILLLVISDYEKVDFNKNIIRVRNNLFLIALIMSFIKIYSSVVYMGVGKVSENYIIEGLKPLIISLYMYVIFINVIARVEPDIKINESDINTEKLQKPSNLTRRENEIFDLILEGYSNKEISEKLFIEQTTVKKHIQNILKKLNLANTNEIIEKYNDSN